MQPWQNYDADVCRFSRVQKVMAMNLAGARAWAWHTPDELNHVPECAQKTRR